MNVRSSDLHFTLKGAIMPKRTSELEFANNHTETYLPSGAYTTSGPFV